MRIPVPNDRLVAFTLAGALLTAVVAGGLALPGVGLGQAGEEFDSPGTSASDAPQQAAGDAPTPNQDFTPAVQTQSDSGGEEHEAYEEHDGGDDHEEGYEAEGEDEHHEDGE